MAASFKLSAGGWNAMFGASDLNSLPSGSTILSSLNSGGVVVDTSASGEMYFQAEFVGGSISPSGPADVVLVLLPRDSTDTSFVDGEAGATIANQPVWMQFPHAIIGLRTKASSTQLQKSGLVLLPPDKYRPLLLNRAGVALAAGGNQVSLRLVTEAEA